VFVALGIQLEVRIHHMAICDLYGSALFSTLSKKQQDFRKKKEI
jgi:hypothetical protein